MAQFETGDKVKFLNSVGGGIVKRVQDGMVYVEDETGFDMPFAPSELIRMADMEGAGRMFNDNGKNEMPAFAKSPLSQKAVPEKPADPDEELRALRSQVANLKDQVAKLRHQLENLQRMNASKLNENILLSHMVSAGEAEVDLHISMLHEHPDTLSAHEVFELQMRYFRACMNHAMLNHVKRVVFIHGVGKGILKDEIVKELKQYDNIHFFDAPMAKYGVGATEVYFPN